MEALARRAHVRQWWARLDAADLRRELRGYGAWDDRELADHDANLRRILWLAACDIAEGAC